MSTQVAGVLLLAAGLLRPEGWGLAVLNLLPVPLLDGGHLLYYSLEVLTGRPVSERFGELAQRAGIEETLRVALIEGQSKG